MSLCGAIQMQTLRVTIPAREACYAIQVHSANLGAIGEFARSCVAKSELALVVCDAAVKSYADVVLQALEQQGFRSSLAVVPSGESSKSLEMAARLYDALIELPADRQTLVVALGGGVIGDLAGFVAATFNRGLPLLMVPTTLLAMVDSAIGGKVAVNHPRGKNLIGAFYQPVGVWITLNTLDTLPEREYRSGLAEVVKYGVIMDARFFEYIEANVERILARDKETLQHIVVHCCRLKANIVEQDPCEETGLRAILNYGHTFAHALETLGSYSEWLHGEAVAVGMICASRLAEKLGRIPGEVTERQRNLLRRLGLPVQLKFMPVDELLAIMRHDKKARAGRLRFILPNRIGCVELVENVPESLVRETLLELMNSSQETTACTRQ
jgi:3-dehydroquinate synthase